MRLETKLEITHWDERPYRELDDGVKFARTDVSLTASESCIEADATMESLAEPPGWSSRQFRGRPRVACAEWPGPP